MAGMSWTELARLEPHGVRVAVMAMYVCERARQNNSHALQAFTERSWRDLTLAAAHGDVGKPWLRCYRCGVVGTLSEWYLQLTSCCGAWPRYIDRCKPSQEARLLAMDDRCQAYQINAALAYAAAMEDR